MAYNVSENYREKVYSGEALYDCRLYINNTLVPIEQISSIKVSSPIIDTTQDTGSVFHIGTFISQKLDIKFRNLNGLTLNNNPSIDFEMGLYINNAYEYVPIGKYLIDELGENYQQTCEITCMDYAVKFKSNLDISQFFNQDNYIYASDLFEAICGYYGVTVGTYPETNNNKKIYFYDNSITGKQYIMFLAELFGGNAKIERNGSCSIIPLNNYTDIEINALTSKKFEVGDTYTLSRICYDNGKQKYQAGGNVIQVNNLPSSNIDITAYYYLTTNMKYYKYINNQWQEDTTLKNTLYIKTNNLFITQQEDINAIYQALQGFSVTNVSCENRMDFSVDCWDIVRYTLEEGIEYYTFYDNTINFNGVAMGKVETKIPLKVVEETTNVITANTDAKIRKIQTTVDEQNLVIETTVEQVGEQNQKITKISQDIDEINSKISDISDVTVHGESNYAQVELDNINASEPIMVKVHPIVTNISYLYPCSTLYPSSTTYLKVRMLKFTNTTTSESIDYEIPADLLYYSATIYDEFYLDYESQTCQITKRCGYNADGSVYQLQNEEVISYTYPSIPLENGNYTITLLGYDNAYLFVRLMASNIYTDQFATKIELDSAIRETKSEIDLSVNQKLTNYATTESMNSAINVKANEINQSVSTTYETKGNANNNYNTLNNKAQTAQNTADTATNKADAAQNTADGINTNLTANYYTKTQTDSQISQSASDITASVSQTYITKTQSASDISTAQQAAIDSANNTTDNKLTNYSTTNQMNSAIGSAINNIDIGGRNYALGTATNVTIQGTNTNNQTGLLYDLSLPVAELNLVPTGELICSFDMEVSGTITGTSGTPAFNVRQYNSPYTGVNVIETTAGKYHKEIVFTNRNWTTSKIGFRANYLDTDVSVTISNLKVEIGNKYSAWTPAPEDSVQVERVVQEYYLSTSNLQPQEGNWEEEQPEWQENTYIWERTKIYWEVGEPTTTTPVLAKSLNKANETANTAYQETTTMVKSTEYKQDKDSFEMSINTLTDNVKGVGDNLTTYKEEQSKYLRYYEDELNYDKGTLELGESDSPFKTKITNEEMAFTENDNKVAYINTKTMYITKAEILNSLILGNFGFTPLENGSVTFGKIK